MVAEISEVPAEASAGPDVGTLREPGIRWLERSRFVVGKAPEWPFTGLVQLWHGPYEWDGEWHHGWVLRYRVWEADTRESRDVPLPSLEVACLGQVALVPHGERGVEVGGASRTVSSGFWVPWGGDAVAAAEPSEALLEEASVRPSNVAVNVEGDLVHLGEGASARVYPMRQPVRGDGERWQVQARHDGELFVMTVHPAHLECISGVSWLSWADTGDLAFCGANTAATAFVAPDAPDGDLVLPDPDAVGTYASCPVRMDLSHLGPYGARSEP